ncbi:DNA-directed RNA polymerase subunit alpha, putative [Plasmodium yoelii]|nr:DNA-directed RNA polymerase subunit alpha, putative [Plasmodium yoelii]CDU20432.1 DNA-directed RNA polymerase alpha chain, putative [Plasmodium yoelii]VTZ81392.1 DNA-directed RNA polymerase subunit alpha, putative [Plasmodium yoelii]|eukprot:XP_022812823.1 DNA-directed RNA polymerase subunit alpha, putative [Plasmodium yoelii]
MLLLLYLLFITTCNYLSYSLIPGNKRLSFLPIHSDHSRHNYTRNKNRHFRSYYKNEKRKGRNSGNRNIYNLIWLDSENKDDRETEWLNNKNSSNKDDMSNGSDIISDDNIENDITDNKNVSNNFHRFNALYEGDGDTEDDNITSEDSNITDENDDKLLDIEGLNNDDRKIIESENKVTDRHRYNVYDNEIIKKDSIEIDMDKADKIDREKSGLPPYVYESGNVFENEPMDYEPEVYDFNTYNKYFDELCKEKKPIIDSYQLDKDLLDDTYFDAKKGGPKTFGFKFKQIQPVKYHQGRSYTYFFMHSHEVELSPIFLNAFRRVAIKHLKGGRVTALRIPGMKHEYYCIVGVRENFFDLSQNLRQITFKNVPEDADMNNYIIGKFRIKGPMIVVAGHMQLPKNIEIINKNQYICYVAAGSYLEMDVKIESIEEYVMPEYGSQSRNRDICKDNFIHFCSSCTPVEYFGFTGQRRGINLDILGEINIVEMHTDGSITPKTALLKTIDYMSENFQYIENALHNNCHSCEDGSVEEEFRNPEFYMDKERYTDVPWNKYKSTLEEVEETKSWLYRKDVHRQYNIDPESAQSKQEREILWQKKKKMQMEINKRREQIKKGPTTEEGEIIPDDERHDCLLDWPVDKSERNMNPPRWVIERPLDKTPHIGHEEIYDEGI